MKIARNIMNVLQNQYNTQPVTQIYVKSCLIYIFHRYNLKRIFEDFETAIFISKALSVLSLDIIYFMATH